MPAGLLWALLLGHALDHPKRDTLRLAPDRITVEAAYAVAPGEDAQALRRLFDRDRDGRLAPDRITVEAAYAVAPGEDAQALRRLFDRDRDGRLAGEEARAASTLLTRLAVMSLAVAVDGLTVPLARREVRESGVVGAVEDPGGIELVVALEHAWTVRGPAPRVVRLADRDRDVRTHVPVRLEVAPGLVFAGASGGLALGVVSPEVLEAIVADGAAVEVAVVLAPPAAP